MPNPRSLLSLYPTEEIITKIKTAAPDKIHVYVDLKNVMQSLFLSTIVEEIALNTQNNGKLDSTIFQSIILYLSKWKRYFNELDIPGEIFIATDSGPSKYHFEIYSKYKENRRIANSKLTMYDEEFREIRHKNVTLAGNVVNRLPGVHLYDLNFLESDFVPYWLITRKFQNLNNVFHIVCSNDHDMYQIVTAPNIRQLHKSSNKGVQLLNESACYSKLFGMDTKTLNVRDKLIVKLKKFNRRYLSALLAVVGDTGDGVPGVHRIGPAKALDLFEDDEITERLLGTPEELNERVSSGGMFFRELDSKRDYGMWNRIIESETPKEKGDNGIINWDVNELLTNSYKLQSFEQLARWLEKKEIVSKINWIKYLDDITDKCTYEPIPTSRSLMLGLNKLEDNYITENDISPIFE